MKGPIGFAIVGISLAINIFSWERKSGKNRVRKRMRRKIRILQGEYIGDELIVRDDISDEPIAAVSNDESLFPDLDDDDIEEILAKGKIGLEEGAKEEEHRDDAHGELDSSIISLSLIHI